MGPNKADKRRCTISELRQTYMRYSKLVAEIVDKNSSRLPEPEQMRLRKPDVRSHSAEPSLAMMCDAYILYRAIHRNKHTRTPRATGSSNGMTLTP